MKTKSLLVILVVFSWILSACQPAQIPPTATATIVPPTNTPVPTNTPKPTSTPIPPTPTIESPAILSEYLDNAKIVKYENFDNGKDWELFDGSRITNGTLEIVGNGWNGLANKTNLKAGDGILVNFKYTKGSVFESFFDYGAWATSPYKRFGVYLDHDYARANSYEGTKGLGGNYLRGNFYLAPDTWYTLLLAIGNNGDFFALVYDPTNPEKLIKEKQSIERWSSVNWTFRIGADKGTILYDDFMIIKFDNIK
jgi:hypothetical protein